jgi:hypothetical protein
MAAMCLEDKRASKNAVPVGVSVHPDRLAER